MNDNQENKIIRWVINNGPSIVTLIHFTILFAVRSYLSLIAEELGAEGMQLSLPSLSYSLIQVIVAIPLGRIVDTYGPRRPAAIGALLCTVSIVGLSFVNSYFIVVIYSILLGIGHTCTIVGTQRVSVSGRKAKGTANQVGFIMFASSGGQFIGPYLGGFIMDNFTRKGFWIIAIIAAFGIITSFLLPRDSNAGTKQEKNSNGMGIKKLANTPNVFIAIAMSAIVLFCQETTLTYFPLYASDMGLTATAIGTIFSIRGITSMLIRPFMGVLSNKFPIRFLMTGSLLIGGITIISYVLFVNYYLLIIVAAISGAFLGLAAPLSLLLIAIYAPSENRGEAISLRVVCNYLGQSASALIFGSCATQIGFGSVFWASGLLMIAFSILNFVKLKENIDK